MSTPVQLRPSLARAPVPDAPGYSFKPDPAAARNMTDLVVAMCKYRWWAGEPSFARMARACRQRMSASTLQRVLAGETLPGQEHVVAVLEGCGATVAEQRAWVDAWRRLAR